MFNHDYSETEKLLKKMVKVVDGAEQKLMSEIEKQKSKSSFMQAGNDAPIDISNDLHATSMDLAQLNLRRSFETDVAEQLEQQLLKKSRLLTLFNRLDLGSKRNKSTMRRHGGQNRELENPGKPTQAGWAMSDAQPCE